MERLPFLALQLNSRGPVQAVVLAGCSRTVRMPVAIRRMSGTALVQCGRCEAVAVQDITRASSNDCSPSQSPLQENEYSELEAARAVERAARKRAKKARRRLAGEGASPEPPQDGDAPSPPECDDLGLD